jgi:hypothetical protein
MALKKINHLLAGLIFEINLCGLIARGKRRHDAMGKSLQPKLAGSNLGGILVNSVQLRWTPQGGL